MAEPYVSPIKEALLDDPASHAWLHVAQATLDIRQEIIDIDKQRDLDPKKSADRALRHAWEQSAREESAARHDLLVNLVDPNLDLLDALSAAALVTSVRCLETQEVPRARTRLRKIGGSTVIEGPDDVFHPPEDVRLSFNDCPLPGAERVFWQADQIVDAVTAVQGYLAEGSEVRVDERHRWSEFRTAYRAGNRAGFSTEVTWTLQVDEPGDSYAVTYPYINEAGIVNAPLPVKIAGARIAKVVGHGDRDSSIGFEYDRTGLQFPDRSDRTIVDVPLPSVLYAAGENVYRYSGVSVGIRLYPESDSLAVAINDHPLPVPYPKNRF